MSFRSDMIGFMDRMSLALRVSEVVGLMWKLGDGAMRLPVLYLHGITRAQREAFRDLVTELTKERRFISLDELEGLKDDGEPKAMLVFDDAMESLLDNAFPALERMRCPATVFVPTGWVGKQAGWQEGSQGQAWSVMSWKTIMELDSPMLRFESHTVTHPSLRRLAFEQIMEEVSASKAALENKLGREVKYLCYPFGEYDGRSVQAARLAGYRGAFSSIHSIWQPRSSPA